MISRGRRLGGPGYRATGERRPEEIGDSNVLAEPPSHDALQVMHVRERTQFFHDRYVHPPELPYFPKVVAFQVDDHHVLRRILLAREQFRRESAVLGRGRPSRPSALDRPRLDLPPSDLEEPFRTRGQDAMVARIEVAAECGGGAAPQPFVRGLRGATERAGGAGRAGSRE